MKQVHHRRPNTRHLQVLPKYPNAAPPSYFSQKALDVVTAIISGMGFVCAMLFLVTMA